MRAHIKEIGDAVIASVRGYVGQAVASLAERLDDLDTRLKALPGQERGEKGEPGRDADPAAIRAEVERAVAALPPAEPGRDADAAAITETVLDQVMHVLEDIPIPKDGKDADPELVRAEVERAVAALPPPEPGRDSDPAAIAEKVSDAVLVQVMAALDAVPVPKDGKDADPELVRAEVERAMATVPKPKDGESVPIEQVQRMVDEAVSKAVAQAMAAVRMPQDGQPGRDALDVEILPAIDEAKAYPRSTYATHAGGLWRAYEATAGMRGWECIVEGLADLSVRQDDADPRVLHASWALSSGKAGQVELHVPMVVDKGVFREGTAYKQGDGCTWGGKYWIAKTDTTDKPEAGSAWRRSVNSGRDGASAYDSAKRHGFAGNEAEWLQSLRASDVTPKRGNGSLPVG